MAAHEALLEACRSSPDDDGPRLVWADAVGGERGELVVLQCDLARGGFAPAEAAARRRRERELIARHGAAWCRLAEPGVERPRYRFRRGFVEALAYDARGLAEHGEAVFEAAPLLRGLATDLRVSAGDPLDALRRLIASPWFRRLDDLHLLDVGVQEQAFDYDPGFEGRGDAAARFLAESGALAQLRGLGISSSGLTAAGVHHLVRSGQLGGLEKLWLREHALGGEHAFGGDAILAMLAHAPRVLSLDLYGVTDLEAFVADLPRLTELHLSGVTDETFAALGRSRAAETVETLRLTMASLERVDGFGAFPRLAALDLLGTHLGDPERAARDLAAAAPPSLRRLRFAYAPSSALRLVVRALGPRLELLDLSGTTVGAPELVDELQPYVAGEVFASAPHVLLDLF